MDTNQIWAVVVAAGRGMRFGKPYNKVLHPLEDGRSILTHCLEALERAAVFDGIVLVISDQDDAAYAELTASEGACPLVRSVVHGGESRQQSVLNGLRALPDDTLLVAVHDAARPFISPKLIRALLESAGKHGAAVPGTALTDTVKCMDSDCFAVETPDRSTMCAVQTPQIFNFSRLMEAHLRAVQDGVPATDDASLYERYIGRVKVVMAPECRENVKVTTQSDVPSAILLPRVGQGYDAHRMVEGRSLVLCGVQIPFDKGLLGHSDADVAVHALMDALLGAAGLGDIGRHFPDSDPRYKGISSMLLLEHVMSLLKEHSLVPVNADVTIVAQRPKLKDHMPAMKRNLCRALSLPENRVNVKATTTEGMGFEGEGLGISSQAVVLLAPSDALK